MVPTLLRPPVPVSATSSVVLAEEVVTSSVLAPSAKVPLPVRPVTLSWLGVMAEISSVPLIATLEMPCTMPAPDSARVAPLLMVVPPI